MQFSGCEGNRQQELIGLFSSCGFYVDDLIIRLDSDYSPNSNGIDGDINDGGVCGWMVGDTSVFSGCDGLHPAGPGDFIPGNAMVIIQMTQDAGTIRSLDEQCKTGLPIYVIRNNCIRTEEAFPKLDDRNYFLEIELKDSGKTIYEAKYIDDQDYWQLPLIIFNIQGSNYAYSCSDILPSETWDHLIHSTLSIDQVSIQQPNCISDRGIIEVISSGQVGSYSIDGGISWQSDSIFSNLGTGTYHIMIRDTRDMCPIQWPDPVEILPFELVEVEAWWVAGVRDTICEGVRHDVLIVLGIPGRVVQQDRYEYSIDGGISFQDSGYFQKVLHKETIYLVFRDKLFPDCESKINYYLGFEYQGTKVVGLAQDSVSACATGEVGIIATGQNLLYSIDGVNYSPDSVVSLITGVPTVVYVKDASSEICVDSLEVTLQRAVEYIPQVRQEGQSGELYLLAASKGPYHLRWSTGDTTWRVENLPVGTNYLDVSDGWGCEQRLIFSVEDNTCVFHLTDSIVDATCETPTTSIYLVSTDTVYQYDYDWSIDSFDGLPYIENVNHGTFSVEVSYGVCTKTINYITPVGGIRSVDYMTEPTQCNGDLGALIISKVIGGQGPYQIDLTGEQFDSNLTISGLGQGIYKYTIVGTLGCLYQDSFEIRAEIDVPFVEPLISFDCDAELYTLDLSTIRGGIAPYELLLNNTPSSANIIIDLSPGAYELEILDASGCSSGIIPIDLMSEVLFSVNPDTSIETGALLQLQAMGDLSQLESYYWEGPEGFLCDCSQLAIKPDLSGKYTFYYITKTGCAADVSFDVDVLKNNIFIPNSFTPNGDNINDECEIYAPNHEVLTIQIFNRWGDKVFSATGPDFLWNGQIRDSKAAPGVYIYQAILQAANGSTQQEAGSVTLIR